MKKETIGAEAMKIRQLGNRTGKVSAAAAAGVLAVALMSAPVLAEQVKIIGEPCPLPLAGDDGGEVAELTGFTLLGVADDSVVIQYQVPAGEEDETGEGGETEEESSEITLVGYVPVTDMLSLLPQLNLERLPYASAQEKIGYGAEASKAAMVQRYLTSLGYLEGEPDGQYGPGTAGAVSEFQRDCGLDATGEVDAATLLALESAADGTLDVVMELDYPAHLTAEEKFASIEGETDKNLEAFTNPSWRFTFDRYEKKGSIDSGLPTGGTAIESPDMERISLETSLKIIISTSKKGKLQLIPAIVIESAGAYRPYVQSVILAQGNSVSENTGAVSTGELNGALVQETAYVPLTEEAISLLENSSELDMRINGKNNKYDLHFSADADKLAAFTEAAKTIM